MSFDLNYLASLGKPALIEEVSEAAIKAEIVANFIALLADLGITYDVETLNSDPAIKLIQAFAGQEQAVKARVNDVARGNYYFFATGSALDHKGAEVDCQRLPDETDERYLARIILAAQDTTTGGSAVKYEARAMAVSTNVKAVKVYRLAPSPVIRIAVLSADNNGVASDALLTAIRSAVTADTFRVFNDTVVVERAVRTTAAITGSITLLPGTDPTIIDAIEADVPAAWDAEAGIGRDLTETWLKGAIKRIGVYDVTINNALPLIAPPNEAVRIASLSLTYAGEAY